MHDRHHFDLFELVLAQHTRCVATRAAGLGPETLGMGGKAQGQGGLVQCFTVHKVGQCHLGGRDQPPAIGGLIAVLAEFWQLAGAIHHVLKHEHRGDGFGQPVVVHVIVQHELRQRAVNTGNAALKHHKPAARQFGTSAKIHPVLNRGQFEMFNRVKVEVARAAHAANFDVVVFIHAIRHIVIERVGNTHEQIGQTCVFGLGLFCQAGHFGLFFGNQRAQTFEFGLIPAGLGGAHGFRGLVLFGLRSFSGEDFRAARFVNRQNL